MERCSRDDRRKSSSRAKSTGYVIFKPSLFLLLVSNTAFAHLTRPHHYGHRVGVVYCVRGGFVGAQQNRARWREPRRLAAVCGMGVDDGPTWMGFIFCAI